MRRLVQWMANKLGYQVTRQNLGSSPYNNILLGMLSWAHRITIVQVGANDGCINDPIFRFVRRFPERTKVLLIEPQGTLLPFLRENYSFHPDHYVFQGAVGPEGPLTLYAVSEDVWDHLSVPYAGDWPPYRAPTGVTSTQRDHVDRWLRTHLPGYPHERDAIKEIEVASRPLPYLLAELGFGVPVDVLQVDAEGYDDEVIYHCDVERVQPRVINYESGHLPPRRKARLESYLAKSGYVLADYGEDTLALLTVHRSTGNGVLRGGGSAGAPGRS